MNQREVTVMVKPGSFKRSVESFGDNKFLVKIEFKEHSQINSELPKMLAPRLGIPPKSFQLVSGFEKDIKIFEIY